jgi:predicted dehydrogenase
MGLIGCGAMGGSDAIHQHNTGQSQVIAFCDVDKPRREAKKVEYEKLYAKEAGRAGWKGIATYNDFRDLIARDDLDAVIIATPEHWHAIPVIEAAKAGKDLYCEKPLAFTVREGRAMVEAVRRYGRVLQTGSQQRSHGEFRRACELVRNGYIGKVHTVYVRIGGPSHDCDVPAEPVPAGLDWNFWVGPAPFREFHHSIHPGGWRSYREFAGGGTTDWGAHHFDIVQWALGMDESGPVEWIPSAPCVSMRYANGAMVYHVFGKAVNEVKWPSPPEGDSNGITFIGDKGWIEVDRAHIRAEPASILTAHIGTLDAQLFRSPGHHQNWLDCIRSRKRPICDVEVGHRSATVCQLTNICHFTGQRFSWDPAREEITDNPVAARLLDYAKREPWRI